MIEKDSQMIFQGHAFDVRRAEVERPDGQEMVRDVVEHPGAVAIVAFVDETSIVMNRQYRHPAGERLWELPAGTLEPGERARSCARRELKEETGYQPGELVRLTKFFSTPGFCSEMIYIYLARDLKKVDDDPIGHEEEGIRNRIMSFEKALKKIDKGLIKDGKTIIGLLMTQKWLFENS